MHPFCYDRGTLMVDPRLAQMKNIGEKTAAWLADAGIETPEQLAMLGAVKAWQRVKVIHPEATLVGLYAVQGALLDIHWNDLPQDMKDGLKEAFEAGR